MLFTNGWIAGNTGDIPLATDQWQKSLSINQEFIEPIYKLAMEKLSPIQVATTLVPDRRPDMLLRLLQATAKSDPDAVVPLAEGIIAHVESRSGIETGVRYATIAQINGMLRRDEEAISSWHRAVTIQGRNLDYRWSYANALRSSGRFDKALDQVTLCRAIRPEDKRFDRLASQLRREISRDAAH